MNITLNEKLMDIEESNTLLELLSNNDLDEKKGIAVALNYEVVPREQWSSTALKNNDKITVITATQGG